MAKEILIKCVCGNEAAYAVDATGVKCKYCRRPIIPADYVEAESVPEIDRNRQIALLNVLSKTNPGQAEVVMALGLFYLANKAYQFAVQRFEEVINIDPTNADAYYYQGIAMLGGKKAFSNLRTTIDSIEQHLQSALAFNPKGIYYYFWAYLRYDHHSRKGYRVSPDYKQLLMQAKQYGVTASEVNNLYKALGVARPEVL
ncbi:MAG: hypothetical protein IJX38_06160 [Clostridia bacterium]|nr:hypothetical protein [Clostridia bacterium]